MQYWVCTGVLVFSIKVDINQRTKKNHPKEWLFRFFQMVGAVGFELTTLWSQTRCATRLRYAPTSQYSNPSWAKVTADTHKNHHLVHINA